MLPFPFVPASLTMLPAQFCGAPKLEATGKEMPS